MQHFKNIQYVYLLNKYLKSSVWRLALRYDIYTGCPGRKGQNFGRVFLMLK